MIFIKISYKSHHGKNVMNRENPQPILLSSGISLEILDSEEGSETKC